jgi:uncharacterized membrane protein
MPNGKMSTSRLEAFSDGVIAIIVTIMVLQLTHPAEPTLASLLKQAPIFLSYALSFLVVAIMWVNHHHLYGFDLAMCGFAFWLLRIELVRQHRHDPEMSEYHSRMQMKNLFSGFLYLSAGGLAHVSIYISYFVYVLIPVMYFLPERKLAEEKR